MIVDEKIINLKIYNYLYNKIKIYYLTIKNMMCDLNEI